MASGSGVGNSDLEAPQRPRMTVQWLTEAANWLLHSSALAGINFFFGNEFGPWTPGRLK